MRIIFELTMPNVGSWNGKWSGENGKYTISKNITKSNFKQKEWQKKFYNKLEKGENLNYYYNFGDGWSANIEVRKAKPREKVTNKFYGYEWMAQSIL